jgi:hypothetical protein
LVIDSFLNFTGQAARIKNVSNTAAQKAFKLASVHNLTDSSFRYVGEVYTFRSYKKGELIGKSAHSEERTPEDCVIIMPARDSNSNCVWGSEGAVPLPWY